MPRSPVRGTRRAYRLRDGVRRRGPRWVLSMELAISASRGAVRTPFPIRSATRTPSTQPQALAKYRNGFVNAERAYPTTANGLRLPKRSESAPKRIFNKLAVVSAMPSIKPMTAVRTPRMLARKNGMRFSSISEEMSLSSDVADITQTLRGKRLMFFCILSGRPYSPSSLVVPGCSTFNTSPCTSMTILNPIMPR